MKDYQIISPKSGITIRLGANDLWDFVIDMRDRYNKAIINGDTCTMVVTDEPRPINIFLDDIRDTSYVDGDGLWEWVVVRTYDDFIALMDTNPTIHQITFDHDIACWENGEERTGLHCFRYMKNKILRREMDLPYQLRVHSANGEGARNIREEWGSLVKNLDRWRAMNDH